MTKHVHSFAERHPDMEDQIRALAARSTAFSDMCTRFARVWDSLNELDQEPMRTEEVQHELRHLETLMLAMAQQQMRV